MIVLAVDVEAVRVHTPDNAANSSRP
jgi:hypothetical protein